MERYSLKKELGLFEATAYGVGLILGAGIYVLIGQASALAGNALWLGFVLAAVVAGFTGLSYAELVSAMPKAGAEYFYAKKAFKNKLLAFLVGWAMIVGGFFFISAVAMGFAGYWQQASGWDLGLTAAGLIALVSLINYWGMRFSSKLNILMTAIEVLGLLIIIYLGTGFIGSVDIFELPPAGLQGIVSAAALIFFAYLGYEGIVKTGEETRDAKSTLPKALILSMIVTTIIYILVAVSAVSVMPWAELAQSGAPLADVANRAAGTDMGKALLVIALFATGNTVLINHIVTSRLIYGMAEDGILPKFLSSVSKARRTPWAAIALTGLFSAAAVFIGSIDLAANIANFSVFIVFLVVNLALIALRKSAGFRPGFRSPINIGAFPVLAGLGALTSAAMIFQYNEMVWFWGLATIASGAIAFHGLRELYRKVKQ